MSKLGTIYDKDLKQKVFYLRGEETYAHTTDVSARMQITEAADAIVLDYWEIKTFRDVGNGTVTIYNNDDVLQIFNWSNGSPNPVDALDDFELEIDYNIDNNIRIEYSGNAYCMGSEYIFDTINKPNAMAYPTEIQVSSDNQYTHNETVVIDASLVSQNHMDLVGEQEIMVYVDRTYFTTVTTEDDGTFSVTTNISNDGLHHIDFLFTGADVSGGRIASSNIAFDISKGCKVSVADYPPIFYQGIDNTISIAVTDYMNQPVKNQTVIFNSTSNTTGNDGVATYTFSTLNNEEYTITSDGASTKYTPNIAVISNIVEDYPSSEFFSKTNVQSETLSFKVNGTNIQENIPISLGIYKDSNLIEDLGTIYTDSSGNASTRVTGKGYGVCTIKADTPVESTEFSYNDYVEYGVANQSGSLYQYSTYGGVLSTLQTGYKFSSPNTLLFYNPLIQGDYEISFKVISASSTVNLMWGVMDDESLAQMGSSFSLALKANNVVTIIKTDDTLTLKVGTTTKATMQFSERNKTSPLILYNAPSSQQITFNNLKIIRS